MLSLLHWRKEFPVLENTVYMISHSLGAMPRRTRDRLNEYADAWSTRSIRAWEEGWWEMPVTVGNLIGRIIGAGEREVTMHPNVSVCQSIIASCFEWNGKRNKIVSEGLNFPSNLYIHHQLEKLGARGRGYLSIRRDRAGQRARSGPGFRHRRLGEVVVRRPGRGLPLRASRSLAYAPAARHRLDGTSTSFRLRSRADRIRGQRLPI